jgi:biopolymer transport protein ExbD
MQFNTGDDGPGLQSEINITPLVDVVLVLLIIFMVVVPLLMDGYDVHIPEAAADVSPAQSKEVQLVLNIEPKACSIMGPMTGEGLPSDCLVTLADQQIPANELPSRVAQILGGQPVEKRVLFLAASDNLNYEGVLRIVDLAKSRVEDLKIEFIATN